MEEKLLSLYVKIDEKIYWRIRWHLGEIIYLVGWILSVVIMLWRCFYGIEFTDEAYTVSDPLSIMHGNIPYVYNTNLTAGKAFIPIIFYAIYEHFVPSLEGIFLYSRLTFTFFRIGIILLCSYLMRNELDRKWRLIIFGCLIPYCGTLCNPDWSYNSISAYLSLLIAFILYSLNKEPRSKYLKLFIAGLLTAFSVFSHPAYAISVLVFIWLIAMGAGKGEKFKQCTIYCCGGFFAIAIVFIPIFCKCEISEIIYGIKTVLYGNPKGYVSSTLLQRISQVGRRVFSVAIIMFVLSSVFYYISKRYIREHENKLKNIQYWQFSVTLSILVSLVLFRGDLTVVGCIFLVATFFMIPLYKEKNSLIWYLAIYNILMIAILMFGSLTGDRFYYCIPLVIPFLIELIKAKSQLMKEIAVVLCVSVIVIQGYRVCRDVYRDESLGMLTTKVDMGVYKGIYTTEDRAKDVVELEEYIGNVISLEDVVAFRDNVPVAYLMRNTNVCDGGTWDIMQWSYDCDDPTMMYRYYKNKQQIPDVIMYIDYGRDESMSIENSSEVFQYNDFVNKYYYLEENDFNNRTFSKVYIYRNNGTFDGDYDKLIEEIQNR